MIEQYFKKGVRFRWNKPSDVAGPQDGAIVAGVRPTAALTYIGLGAAVDPELLHTHVSAFGLQMNMAIPHRWLDYAPGRTARVPAGAQDVLTGFMSGCIIARSSQNGMMHIAHVGTVVGNAAVNNLVKQTFAATLTPQGSGFNPADEWDFHELATVQQQLGNFTPPKICALVTTAGRFFSVAMISDGNNEWTCLGCRPCTAVPGIALKARLRL